jgi:hypothetical protein
MKRPFLAVLLTGLVIAADGPPKDPRRALDKAVRTTAAAKNYCFTIQEQPGTGARGAVEGKYQKGRPAYFKAGNFPFYQQGKTLIYQQGGKWHKSKTGIQSDPLIVLVASAQVRRARLPHVELADFAKNFQGQIKAARKAGDTLYSGNLTAAAVKKLAPTEAAGVARSGTAQLWVNAQGQVVKYTITLKLKGRRGNAEVDGTTTKTVTLKGIGSTKVEVPKEAGKLLPGK